MKVLTRVEAAAQLWPVELVVQLEEALALQLVWREPAELGKLGGGGEGMNQLIGGNPQNKQVQDY